MKLFISTLLIVIVCGRQTLFGQNNNNISLGTKLSIQSTLLDEERVCFISLPDSYEASTEKKYPVLIVLDGYTHFKSTAGTTHFLSSDRNRNYLIPESIVVAIENVDRERDFTVTKIKTKRPNTMGGGRKFLGFIETELIPYLDKNYRTEPHRILIGHSLGGLLTLNSYMNEESLFNAFIVIDPSIWWDEQMMIEKVKRISTTSLKKKLYIATANHGASGYERNKQRHDKFFDLLTKRMTDSLTVDIDYFENENHRSVPLIAIYYGLKYVYNQE